MKATLGWSNFQWITFSQTSSSRMAHLKPQKTGRVSFISWTHRAYLYYTHVFVSWEGFTVLYIVPPSAHSGTHIRPLCWVHNTRTKLFHVSTLNALFRYINAKMVRQLFREAGLNIQK